MRHDRLDSGAGTARKSVRNAHLGTHRFVYRAALFALTVVFVAFLFSSCSKQESESQPLVTVQTAPAEQGTIQQVISAEAILFPRDQAAITPKVVAPVKRFYINRGSAVHRGQLLAVLENRDLTAAEVENKGIYEQAQAAYGLETSSALPEEWQKAELDRKTAKEAYDAEQKVYDSRRILFQQGAMPRKELDASAVSSAQAKATYDIAEKHLAALQAAGKEQQLKSARGQLTSAEGKYQGAAAQLAYTEIRSPIDGVVTDRPTLAKLLRGIAAADRDGHFIGSCASPHPAERSRSAEARRQCNHNCSRRSSSSREGTAGQSRRSTPTARRSRCGWKPPNPDGRLRPGTTVLLSLSSRLRSTTPSSFRPPRC